MRHYKRVDGELVEMDDAEVTQAKKDGRRFAGITHVPHPGDHVTQKDGNVVCINTESDLVLYTAEQEAQRDRDVLEDSRNTLKKALEVEAVSRINQVLPSVTDLAGLKSMEDVLANLATPPNAPIDKAKQVRAVLDRESEKVETMSKDDIENYNATTDPRWPA